MKIDLQNYTKVTKCYDIIAYETISIQIIPSTSANSELIFYCDDDKLYSRRYLLINTEYSDWTTNDYLHVITSNNVIFFFEN